MRIPPLLVQHEDNYERNLGPQVRDASGISTAKVERGCSAKRSWSDYLDENGKTKSGEGLFCAG